MAKLELQPGDGGMQVAQQVVGVGIVGPFSVRVVIPWPTTGVVVELTNDYQTWSYSLPFSALTHAAIEKWHETTLVSIGPETK